MITATLTCTLLILETPFTHMFPICKSFINIHHCKDHNITRSSSKQHIIMSGKNRLRFYFNEFEKVCSA